MRLEQCWKTASRVKKLSDVSSPLITEITGPTSCYTPGLMNTTRRSKVWTSQEAVDGLLKTSLHPFIKVALHISILWLFFVSLCVHSRGVVRFYSFVFFFITCILETIVNSVTVRVKSSSPFWTTRYNEYSKIFSLSFQSFAPNLIIKFYLTNTNFHIKSIIFPTNFLYNKLSK